MLDIIKINCKSKSHWVGDCYRWRDCKSRNVKWPMFLIIILKAFNSISMGFRAVREPNQICLPKYINLPTSQLCTTLIMLSLHIGCNYYFSRNTNSHSHWFFRFLINCAKWEVFITMLTGFNRFTEFFRLLISKQLFLLPFCMVMIGINILPTVIR